MAVQGGVYKLSENREKTAIKASNASWSSLCSPATGTKAHFLSGIKQRKVADSGISDANRANMNSLVKKSGERKERCRSVYVHTRHSASLCLSIMLSPAKHPLAANSGGDQHLQAWHGWATMEPPGPGESRQFSYCGPLAAGITVQLTTVTYICYCGAFCRSEAAYWLLVSSALEANNYNSIQQSKQGIKSVEP